MAMIDFEDDEDLEDEDLAPPAYDRAGLHIMKEQCSTCIFRPGNLMHLNEGRLKDMTDQTDAGDTNVVCHQTLDREVGAFCKGSVDRAAGQMVRIAERLGAIVEDEGKGTDS